MHLRIPLRAKARMEFEAERFFLSETTVDLSAGGAFVATESKLEPGSRCRFTISLTDRGPVVEGTGEVAHVRAGEDGPTGVGLRFLTLDEEGAALLDELTEVYHREGSEAMTSLLETAADEKDPSLPDTLRMAPIRSGEEDPEEDHPSPSPSVDELDDTAPIQPLPVSRPEGGEAAEAETEPELTTMIDTSEFREEHGEGELHPEARAGGALEPGAAVEPEIEPEDEPERLPLDELPAEEETGSPMDDDPLSKTLDVARDRHDLPRTESTRARSRGVLVWSSILVVFAVGAWLFWRHQDAFQWPGLLATQELAGWEGEEPYVVAEVEGSGEEPGPAAREARGPEGARIGTTGVGPEVGSEDRPGPGERFRSVQEIRWQEGDDGLWISIFLDGAIPPEEYRVFRPPEGPPREVVQLFGVDEPYPFPEVSVGSPLVAKIRTGFHEVEGVREQRLVLDLAGADVELDRIEVESEILRLLLVGAEEEGAEGMTDD